MLINLSADEIWDDVEELVLTLQKKNCPSHTKLYQGEYWPDGFISFLITAVIAPPVGQLFLTCTFGDESKVDFELKYFRRELDNDTYHRLFNDYESNRSQKLWQVEVTLPGSIPDEFERKMSQINACKLSHLRWPCNDCGSFVGTFIETGVCANRFKVSGLSQDVAPQHHLYFLTLWELAKSQLVDTRSQLIIEVLKQEL